MLVIYLFSVEVNFWNKLLHRYYTTEPQKNIRASNGDDKVL